MSATVKIPTQLRTLTDGADEVKAEGGTLSAVIEDLERRHPGLRERLVDDSGQLRRFVNVYLDDEDVRFLQGLSTELPDGAKVSIIPAVAGGATGAWRGKAGRYGAKAAPLEAQVGPLHTETSRTTILGIRAGAPQRFPRSR